MLNTILPNFSKSELECKCCGLFNYSAIFLICLQALRYILGFPLVPTSGCRCWKHNADPKVGGEPTSRHLCTDNKGKLIEASAADVTGKDLNKIFKVACASGMFNEVIWYRSGNFIHLAQDPNQKGNYHKII